MDSWRSVLMAFLTIIQMIAPNECKKKEDTNSSTSKGNSNQPNVMGPWGNMGMGMPMPMPWMQMMGMNPMGMNPMMGGMMNGIGGMGGMSGMGSMGAMSGMGNPMMVGGPMSFYDKNPMGMANSMGMMPMSSMMSPVMSAFSPNSMMSGSMMSSSFMNPSISPVGLSSGSPFGSPFTSPFASSSSGLASFPGLSSLSSLGLMASGSSPFSSSLHHPSGFSRKSSYTTLYPIFSP